MEKNYRELYEKITKSDWFKKAYHNKSLGECPIIVEELEESEDERTRKELIDILKKSYEFGGFTLNNKKDLDRYLAYLEKQKYNRMKPIYDARESFESALEKAWNDYHNGYENVDKLEDDYVENAFAKGFREGYLFGIEKQKEQKPSVKQLGGTFNSYDMAKTFAEGQYYVMEHPERFGLCKKPAEWGEEDEKILNSILNDIRQRVIPDEEDQEWLKSLPERFELQPKQEWSKRDESIIEGACNALEIHGHTKLASMLKSIRPQPNLEWNEEDKEVLNNIVVFVSGYADKRVVSRWVEFLKSLPERFNFQAKQEVPKDAETLTAKLVNLLKSYRIGEKTAVDLADRIADTYGVQRYLDGVCDASKNEWSEEDERMLSRCVKSIESSKQFADSDTFKKAKDNEIDWLENRLKSLRPQPKQELSIEKAIQWFKDTFFFQNNSSGRGEDYEITTHDFDSMEEMFESFRKSAEIDEYEIIKKHITHDSLSGEVNKRLKECGWYVTEW